jgi:1-deoxy-D-xylulose-5-phosphate reductoisomerase
VLNAANEEAVAAFLDMKISFPMISTIVAQAIARIDGGSDENLQDLLEADQAARELARSLVSSNPF